MMKSKLILILISNMFMLHFIIPLFKVLRLNNLNYYLLINPLATLPVTARTDLISFGL